jgi:hypothetical protein
MLTQLPGTTTTSSNSDSNANSSGFAISGPTHALNLKLKPIGWNFKELLRNKLRFT